MKTALLILGMSLIGLSFGAAADKTVIRLGVQALGTLEWELSALQSDPVLASAGVDLSVHRLANPEAGKIALQAGSVDMIVSDWIWVSRMRSSGSDLTFYPYSTTSGALIVPADSTVSQLADLKGKRLGIAGGELDKNWILLQALAKQLNVDLSTTETVFGAPPLITEQLKQGRIDAALTYWHFAARLEAQGYRQILDGKGLMKALGIQENVPNLGYVFKQAWAQTHQTAIEAFFSAGERAKHRLCTEDAAWDKAVPPSRTDDSSVRSKLRQRYCEGRVDSWQEAELQAAGRLYQLLRKVSQNRLTGLSEQLQAGTFWTTVDSSRF